MSNKEVIERQFDGWLKKIKESNPLNIADIYQFGLRKNGVFLEDCSFEDIITILCNINKTMYTNGGSALVVPEHGEVISWCAQILSCRQTSCFKIPEEFHLEMLMKSCVSAFNSSPECQELDTERNYFIFKANYYHVYLTFPFLEGVLRKACSEYIGSDGRVLKFFEVKPKGKEKSKYKPSASKIKKCSNLFHMIIFLRDSRHDPELSEYLVVFEEVLRMVFSGSGKRESGFSFDDFEREPFEAIYAWRNSTLHGVKSYSNIFYVVMTLGLLVALYLCKSKYEETRNQFCEIKKQIDVSRHPSMLYPPR